uniref:Si:ch211-165i18.2 n=1 Tax=Sinocyclocheilus rhinocerous TaxID=307959 RepID=A0A673I941_9TELE
MFALALLTCIVLRAFSAQAKVSDAFECKEFFYRNTEPGGMDQNAKKICQWTSKGIYYYATLYSVYHRIPLYSAYRFDPACSSDSGRPNVWHLEPQNRRNQNDYKGNQAISSDYSDTGYDRGHLYPNSFQCGDGRTATFTLTNAAPMDPCFNRIQWGKSEKDLRKPSTHLRKYNIIPQREISEDPERVIVPSHIWTAVCYKHNSDDSKSFSFGYIGENLPEGSISVMGVSALNYRLSALYSEHSDTSHSTLQNPPLLADEVHL